LVIEHNLDVIKQADWIVDLGPEGGDEGGEVIATGTPEDVAEVEESATGQYLRSILAERAAAAASLVPLRECDDGRARVVCRFGAPDLGACFASHLDVALAKLRELRLREFLEVE